MKKRSQVILILIILAITTNFGICQFLPQKQDIDISPQAPQEKIESPSKEDQQIEIECQCKNRIDVNNWHVDCSQTCHDKFACLTLNRFCIWQQYKLKHYKHDLQCNGLGYYDELQNLCICNNGQVGQNCINDQTEEALCPNNCTDLKHGRCDKKSRTCKCFSKFTGEDCSITAYMPQIQNQQENDTIDQNLEINQKFELETIEEQKIRSKNQLLKDYNTEQTIQNNNENIVSSNESSNTSEQIQLQQNENNDANNNGLIR